MCKRMSRPEKVQVCRETTGLGPGQNRGPLALHGGACVLDGAQAPLRVSGARPRPCWLPSPSPSHSSSTPTTGLP